MKAFPTSADIADLAKSFAALGHPRRLEILQHLLLERSCCCGEVVARLDLAQSTVSQHLKVLVDAGLVKQAAQGQKSLYAVELDAFELLHTELARLSACCVGKA